MTFIAMDDRKAWKQHSCRVTREKASAFRRLYHLGRVGQVEKLVYVSAEARKIEIKISTGFNRSRVNEIVDSSLDNDTKDGRARDA